MAAEPDRLDRFIDGLERLRALARSKEVSSGRAILVDLDAVIQMAEGDTRPIGEACGGIYLSENWA